MDNSPVPNTEEHSDKPWVFISYNSKDRKWARKINNALEQADYRTFFDINNIRPDNRSVLDPIYTALEQCTAVIICWGENGWGTCQSEEFSIAAYRQIEESKQIIKTPLQLLVVSLPDAPLRPARLGPRPYVDFRKGLQPYEVIEWFEKGKTESATTYPVQKAPLSWSPFSFFPAIQRQLQGTCDETASAIPLTVVALPHDGFHFRDACLLPLVEAGSEREIVGDLVGAFTAWVKQRKRCFVLVGDPGSGKTTLLGRLAVELAAHSNRWRGPVPVVLRAKEAAKNLDPANPSLLWPPTSSINAEPPELLKYLLRKGRAWILLDGLDEVATEKEREVLFVCLKQWVEQARGNLLLTTSRTALPPPKQGLPPSELRMAPFTGQVSASFLAWLRERGVKEAELPRADAAHLAWIANPLGLTLYAQLIRQNGHYSHRGQASLYQDYCEAILRLEKRTLMQAPAGFVLAERALRWQRGEFDEQESLGESLRTGAMGLLSGGEGEHLGFIHPTFQEFFAAVYLVAQQQTATLVQYWCLEPRHWSRVVGFAAQLLAKQKTRTEFLQALMAAISAASDAALARHEAARCLLGLDWKADQAIPALARQLSNPVLAPEAQAPLQRWLDDPLLAPGLVLALTYPEFGHCDGFWLRLPQTGMADDDPLWQAWLDYLTRLPSWHPALPRLWQNPRLPSRLHPHWTWLRLRHGTGVGETLLRELLELGTGLEPAVELVRLAALLEFADPERWRRLLEPATPPLARTALWLTLLLRPWWPKLVVPAIASGDGATQAWRRWLWEPLSHDGRNLARARRRGLQKAMGAYGGWNGLHSVDASAAGQSWQNIGIPASYAAALIGALLLHRLGRADRLPRLEKQAPDALAALGWWAWEDGAAAVETAVAQDGLPDFLSDLASAALAENRVDNADITRFLHGDDQARLRLAAIDGQLTEAGRRAVGLALAAPDGTAARADLLDWLLSLAAGAATTR